MLLEAAVTKLMLLDS